MYRRFYLKIFCLLDFFCDLQCIRGTISHPFLCFWVFWTMFDCMFLVLCGASRLIHCNRCQHLDRFQTSFGKAKKILGLVLTILYRWHSKTSCPLQTQWLRDAQMQHFLPSAKDCSELRFDLCRTPVITPHLCYITFQELWTWSILSALDINPLVGLYMSVRAWQWWLF